MSASEFVVSKKLVYGLAIGLIALIAILLFARKSLISNSSSVNENKLIAGSSEKFAFLSGQGTQRSIGYLSAGACLS